jgi:hypothetical protein
MTFYQQPAIADPHPVNNRVAEKCSALDPARERVTMRVPVKGVLNVLGSVQQEGKLKVDHIYDY